MKRKLNSIERELIAGLEEFVNDLRAGNPRPGVGQSIKITRLNSALTAINTMFDYREHLPAPPLECNDPLLFRMLNEFHFVRWHPDYEDRKKEMQREIFSEPVLQRAEVGTTDPAPELRFYCGELLIWARRNEAAAFTLTLLADPSEYVRGGIADILLKLRDDRYLEPLVKLARSDPSPYVRGCAAMGLGGQDPVVAIPILLEVLDHDHEETEFNTPSSRAATALDEMMQSEWTQKRIDDSLRSLQPLGMDVPSLREHSLVFLQHCRQARGL